MSRTILISVFLISIFWSAPVFAESQEHLTQASLALDQLTREVNELEQQSEEILRDQDSIIEEIKNLKVWVHHR